MNLGSYGATGEVAHNQKPQQEERTGGVPGGVKKSKRVLQQRYVHWCLEYFYSLVTRFRRNIRLREYGYCCWNSHTHFVINGGKLVLVCTINIPVYLCLLFCEMQFLQSSYQGLATKAKQTCQAPPLTYFLLS